MRIGFPRAGAPIAGGKAPEREWIEHWLRVWRSLGYSGDLDVFADLRADPWAADLENGADVTVSGNVIAPGLTAATTDRLAYLMQLPGSYKPGTDLKPFVEWAPSSTDTGNIVMSLEYVVAGKDDTIGVTTTESKTVAASGTTNKITRTEFTDIDGDAFNRGDYLMCRLTRTGGDAADTFTGTMIVLGLGFKMSAQGIGHEHPYPGGE